jgi:sugar O-acyltransferase (sialic acid O-acetyltransferase NeuD family)
MSGDRDLVIVGGGGAGLEALWVARRMLAAGTQAFGRVLGFLDDNAALTGQILEGAPVLGTVADFVARQPTFTAGFHCAIGRNLTRRSVSQALESGGFLPVTLIDPTALVAPSAVIGAGCYLAAQVFVGPAARLGRHVLVNVGASLGHHCRCGDFSQICPGGRISGHGHLGEGGFVGSNGVAAPGVAIADWATVGAASLVVHDVPAKATALGVPARILGRPSA